MANLILVTGAAGRIGAIRFAREIKSDQATVR